MALRIVQFLIGFALLAGGGYGAWLNRALAASIFPPDPGKPLWLLAVSVAAAVLGLVLALGSLGSRKKQRLEKERQASARRAAIAAADDLYQRRATAAADTDWRSGPLPPDPTPEATLEPHIQAEAEPAPLFTSPEPAIAAPKPAAPRMSFSVPPPEARPVFTAPTPEPEVERVDDTVIEPAHSLNTAPERVFSIPQQEARPVFTTPAPEAEEELHSEPAMDELGLSPADEQQSKPTIETPVDRPTTASAAPERAFSIPPIEPRPVFTSPALEAEDEAEPEPTHAREPIASTAPKPVAAAAPPEPVVLPEPPAPEIVQPAPARMRAKPLSSALSVPPPAFRPVNFDARLSSVPDGLAGFPAAATLAPLPHSADPPARPLPPHSYLGFAIVPKKPAAANGSHAAEKAEGDVFARIRTALADGQLDAADHLIAEERARLKNAGDSEALALAELAALAGDHAAAAGRIGGAKWLWRLSLRRFADVNAISSPEARAVSERLRLADQ